MGILTGIAVVIKAGKLMAEAVSDAKAARELLTGMSPAEVRVYAERFVQSADKLSEAHSELAKAHQELANTAADALGILAVAVSSLNQGITTLTRIFDFVEQQYQIDTQSLRAHLPIAIEAPHYDQPDQDGQRKT